MHYLLLRVAETGKMAVVNFNLPVDRMRVFDGASCWRTATARSILPRGAFEERWLVADLTPRESASSCRVWPVEEE